MDNPEPSSALTRTGIADAGSSESTAPKQQHQSRRRECGGHGPRQHASPRRCRRLGVAEVASASPAMSRSICTRASPIACNRRFGSFSRHHRSNAWNCGGSDAGRARQSGVFFNTDASVSEIVGSSNSLRPVIISNSTTPNAQMSARRSATYPRTCSGAMYAAVPRIMPAAVRVAGLVIVGELASCCSPVADAVPSRDDGLASPKSSTFTVPSDRRLMLAGLRSRCTMPASCAASSASAELLRNRQHFVERQRPAAKQQ